MIKSNRLKFLAHNSTDRQISFLQPATCLAGTRIGNLFSLNRYETIRHLDMFARDNKAMKYGLALAI